MKVFLTGATGCIGSVIAEKLLHAGHDVVGLARSDASADKLDWTAANAGDVAAVNAMIAGLRGTGKPFIHTSGTGVLGDTGEVVYDEDTPVVPSEFPAVKALQRRLGTEKAVLGAAGDARTGGGHRLPVRGGVLGLERPVVERQGTSRARLETAAPRPPR